MKLLLVQTGFFGDLILSTPVIEGLLKAFPGSELTVLTTPQAAGLVRGDKRLRVLTFDKRGSDSGFRGLWSFAAKLRRENYDAAFSLHKSYRTALVLRLAGIPVRVGFKEASLSVLYTSTASRGTLPHEVLRNMTLFSAAGLNAEQFEDRLRLVLDSEVQAQADALLGGLPNARLAGIAPGSVWATKRWTTEGFAAVAAGLTRAGFSVVLIGGPDDTHAGTEIERLAGVSLCNLIGKVGLSTSAAVISRCAVLVTNDSAPLHMASALGTPCAAVFCATVPEFGYGPWRVPHRIVEVAGLECRPCGRHGGLDCPTGTHACRLQIAPERVIEAVLELAPLAREAGA